MSHYVINLRISKILGKFATWQGANEFLNEAKFTGIILSSEEDLDQLTKAQHKALAINLKGENVWELITNMDLSAKEHDMPKGKGPSKVSIIRELFTKKNSYTKEELMNASGYDVRNIHMAMNILKNPERTKPGKMLFTDYDKKEKTYTLVEE
jgi:hypothetical protein